ncbi:hypothetical protein LMG28614_00528 [Paraburkholderia ultramafica]|uniref:Uncharacterized protein n=1 Tax=Paraburkholderia ultramafica TaxID=1544867 RepID=A0A6S7AU36_9BURK|nr:hypothetical protein [Paraburkholderia ultramafica]CAB3778053.1 hypothetical protein LMG28614_00528 [Paraburkholderia ultramafica]
MQRDAAQSRSRTCVAPYLASLPVPLVRDAHPTRWRVPGLQFRSRLSVPVHLICVLVPVACVLGAVLLATFGRLRAMRSAA